MKPAKTPAEKPVGQSAPRSTASARPPQRSGSTGSTRSKVGWWPWVLMAVVVVALLAVGSLGGDPPTLEERAQNLEESIRCPSCASQSVAHSDAPSAEAVRVLIAERLAAGNSDEEIRDYVAASYPNGRELLLDPSGQGFGALVWALPVVAVIVAVAALVRRFGDWRPGAIEATAEDRELVAAALARSGGAGAERPPVGDRSGRAMSGDEPAVGDRSGSAAGGEKS